MVMSMKN
jgi:hypothetical protein